MRIGARATRWLWVGLVVAAGVALGALAAMLAAPLLLVALVPLVVLLARTGREVLSAPLGPALVPVLEATARAQLAFAVLVAGVVVSLRVVDRVAL